jgi:hypothetical protein
MNNCMPIAMTLDRCVSSCTSWPRRRELDARLRPRRVRPSHTLSHDRSRAHSQRTHGHLRGNTHAHALILRRCAGYMRVEYCRGIYSSSAMLPATCCPLALSRFVTMSCEPTVRQTARACMRICECSIAVASVVVPALCCLRRAPRCPLRSSRVCNKIMRADGMTDGANVHAFLVLMSMRAPAESCVHEPALKYCTRSPLMVSWHGT